MYECPICGATSSDAGVMERHLAIHEDPTSLEPPVVQVIEPPAVSEELADEGLGVPPTWHPAQLLEGQA